MDCSVPVVVLACGPAYGALSGYGALAVARSLGRLGILTYLVCGKGLFPIAFSRYWAKRFTWDLSVGVGLSLRFLLDVARQVGTRPILLCVTDSAAVFVAENADALATGFTFPRVSSPLMHLLTNKWGLFLAAKEHGVPTPETVYPRRLDDIREFLDGARFPILVKGADPLLPQGSTKEIVHTSRDLFEKYDRYVDSETANLVLQEYIPGGDDCVWMCNGYFDRQSECRAIFSGRKIRQWHPHAGVASLGVCQPNETVENATRHFMKALGYRGLVGIGYRYDARDGLYKILDVNARVSAVFRLFLATNGVDVVRACYLDLTGQDIPALVPSIGRKWMLEEDLFSALRQAWEGNLTPQQWLASLRGVKETHWFAPDDPAPILVWSWTRLRDAALKKVGDSPRRRTRNR